LNYISSTCDGGSGYTATDSGAEVSYGYASSNYELVCYVVDDDYDIYASLYPVPEWWRGGAIAYPEPPR